MKIGFVGLGNMGAGMCANLVGAGHAVWAFDLNPEAVKTAHAAGAKGAGSLAELAGTVDVVVTMLPAGKHVLSVYFEPDGIGFLQLLNITSTNAKLYIKRFFT